MAAYILSNKCGTGPHSKKVRGWIHESGPTNHPGVCMPLIVLCEYEWLFVSVCCPVMGQNLSRMSAGIGSSPTSPPRPLKDRAVQMRDGGNYGNVFVNLLTVTAKHRSKLSSRWAIITFMFADIQQGRTFSCLISSNDVPKWQQTQSRSIYQHIWPTEEQVLRWNCYITLTCYSWSN